MDSSQFNHSDDELLSAYVDDELTADQRAAVEERLRTDERAQGLVAELRAASDAVKSLPRVSLGRDLRSSVLDAIDRRLPAAPGAPAEEPTILAMPASQAEDRRSGVRPLVWAAFAIAAALLIMVVLQVDKQAAVRSVAESKREAATGEMKIEADVPAGGEKGLSTEHRDESMAGAARSEGVTRSPLSAKSLDAESPQRSRGVAETEGTVRGMAQPADETKLAATPPAEAEGQPAPAMDGVAQDAAADATSALTLVRAYDVTIADDAGFDAFLKLLAEHRIVLTADEMPAALKLEVKPLVDQQGADLRDASETAAIRMAKQAGESAEAVLVEASPEEIASLVAALRANAGKFQGVQTVDNKSLQRELAAATTAAAPSAAAPPPATADAAADQSAIGSLGGSRRGGFAGGGGIGGGGGGFGADQARGGGGGRVAGARQAAGGRSGGEAAESSSRLSRAWRFSVTPRQADDLLQAKEAEAIAQATPQGAAAMPPGAAAPAAAPAAPASGEPAAPTSTGAAAPVRALFLLRRGSK